jgi:S1-C subfamily serine protease
MQSKAIPFAAPTRRAAIVTLIAAQQIVSAQQATPPATPQVAPNDNQLHSPEINTTLMETTFLITGPSARAGEEGRFTFGTGFVMLRHVKDDSNTGQHILVTAKHVLDAIKGEIAMITLRRRGTGGDAEPLLHPLRIRDKDTNLYVTHPTADVAVIDVRLPPNAIVVQRGSEVTNIDWLATDEFLEEIAIHPGDELLCLGYPLGLVANDAGYPILRGGRIASYPVIPLKKANRILFDFPVQPGNSGGPVYFSFTGRIRKDHLPPFGTLVTYQKVMGLVTQKVDRVGNIDPFIGLIVPSVYIKETIDKLAGFEWKIKES